MTFQELANLQEIYGGLEISRAVHLHDEDEWNKYCISYNGIIVGSELVDADFVAENIAKLLDRTREGR